MAELPRYRRDNLLGAVSPQYSGVALQEATRASQVFSDAMDRVSRAAFGVAERQAKIEGIEYGAANAPTIEQLALAKAEGRDIKEMMPGDAFTVFGTSARSTAVDLVTATIETQARESISGIQALYELGKIDIGEMQYKLATVEDSYSSVLAEISPTSAAKLRASIGLAGNSAFLSAAKAKAKADKQALEVQLATGVQGMIDSVETIFDAGITVSPKGDIVKPADSVEVLRNEIIRFGGMVTNGEAFIRENLRLLDAKVEGVTTASVAEWISEDPIVREKEIRTGTISDQNIASIISDMPIELQQAARKAATETLSSRLSTESALSSRNDRIRNKEFDSLTGDLFRAKAAGDDVQMEQILSRMDQLNEERATSMRETVYTSGGLDNAETIQGLDQLATQGELTLADINSARINKEISESSHRRYLGIIEQQRNDDHQDAMTIAENILRPGVRSMINPGNDDREALKKLGLLENAMILEARGNPGFDRIKFAQDWMSQADNAGFSQAEIETATNKIKALATSLNMDEGASASAVKSELDKRVANGSYPVAGAAAYKRSFTVLGAE